MTSRAFILLVVPIVLLNQVKAAIYNYDLNNPKIYENTIEVNSIQYPWPINTNVDQPQTHAYSSKELNLLGLNSTALNNNDKKYKRINLPLQNNTKRYHYTLLNDQTQFHTRNVSPSGNIVYNNLPNNIVYKQVVPQFDNDKKLNSMKNLGLAQDMYVQNKDGYYKRIAINSDKTLYRYVSPPGKRKTLVIQPQAEHRTQQPSPIRTNKPTCDCRKNFHKALTTENTAFTINAMKNQDKIKNIYLYKIPLYGLNMNNSEQKNRKIYTNIFDQPYIGRNRLKEYANHSNTIENTLPNPYATNEQDEDSKIDEGYNNSYSCDSSDSFEEKNGNITMPTIVRKNTKLIKLSKKFPYKKKLVTHESSKNVSPKGSKNVCNNNTSNTNNKDSFNENIPKRNVNDSKKIKDLRDNLQGPPHVKVDLTSHNNKKVNNDIKCNNDKKVMKHKLNTNIYDFANNKKANDKNLKDKKIQVHIQIKRKQTNICNNPNTTFNNLNPQFRFTDNNLAKLSVRDCINHRYVYRHHSPNNKQTNIYSDKDIKNKNLNYVVTNANLAKFSRKELSKDKHKEPAVPALHLANVQQQQNGNLTERTSMRVNIGKNSNRHKVKNSSGVELIKVNKAAAPAVDPNDQ